MSDIKITVSGPAGCDTAAIMKSIKECLDSDGLKITTARVRDELEINLVWMDNLEKFAEEHHGSRHERAVTEMLFPENEVHKSIQPFITKKQQGYVMGALRELGMLYNPRDADLAPVLKAKQQTELDATRWRAFIDCSRVKFFGWAGYEELDPYGKSPGNYRHFGGEFWTMMSPEGEPFGTEEERSKTKEILTGFADAAIKVSEAYKVPV